ncbi:hypothetical protein Dsin_015940 [Dipteronia sinensis]|uniref:RNase H type-1 domain-containing protein n=1 Tax=Dipteronia sinensis TaxID=43782 RepID=A0AAE0E557_9ROSI|nr:hypothetical protein Dsin_015940 [Dipteronia sinensis]
MGVATTSSLVRCKNVVWTPPSPGFYKVNCDAAIDVRGGRIGFGFIRDSTGSVMASSSQVMTGYFNAQAAEAIAILRGIHFSTDCGSSPCYVESDAEVVVRWINESSHLDSMCGAILAEIILSSSEMIGLCFNYVPRQANQVAHLLAKNALLLTANRFWMEEYPCCVTRMVQADMPV